MRTGKLNYVELDARSAPRMNLFQQPHISGPLGETPVPEIGPLQWQSTKNPRTVLPGFRVWRSQSQQDELWDAFVLSQHTGQFHQSTAWGRVKVAEGWSLARWIITGSSDRSIVGGFQILTRKKGPFRIGYLAKGPVVSTSLSLVDLIPVVSEVGRELSLTALLVQLPDDAIEPCSDLHRHGYYANAHLGLIDATITVDLQKSFAEIEKGFSRSTQKQIRKTLASTLQFRLAGPERADVFFDLLVQTCKRQGTNPNPDSAEKIRRLLHEFGPLSHSGMGSGILEAIEQDKTVAATLLVRFGDRLTAWKKGWTGNTPSLYPAKAIAHQAIKWGVDNGCGVYDFVSIARSIAQNWDKKERPLSSNISGVDEYKLQFGGVPRLLATPRIWFRSPVVRIAHRFYAHLSRT